MITNFIFSSQHTHMISHLTVKCLYFKDARFRFVFPFWGLVPVHQNTIWDFEGSRGRVSKLEELHWCSCGSEQVCDDSDDQDSADDYDEDSVVLVVFHRGSRWVPNFFFLFF